MNRSRALTVVFCISLLAFIFLSDLTKHVRGETEKEKTAAEKNSGGAAAPTEASSDGTMEAYKRKAKDKLTGLEKKTKELEVEAIKTGEKAKSEAKKGIKELQQKREALKKDMEKLEAATRKTWEKAKKKFEAAMEDIEKNCDKVRSFFASE
jgi:chromosome segregation ATPase